MKDKDFIELNSIENQKIIKCGDCGYWIPNANPSSFGMCCNNISGKDTKWDDGCVHGTLLK